MLLLHLARPLTPQNLYSVSRFALPVGGKQHKTELIFSDQMIECTIDLDPEYQRGASDISGHFDCFTIRFLRIPRQPSLAPVVYRISLNTMLDVVWPDTKQVGLVDSILRNYYIPPIIFGKFITLTYPLILVDSSRSAVTRADDGSESRVCIDGKQRLTSIHRYVCLLALDPAHNWMFYIPGSCKGRRVQIIWFNVCYC